MGGALLGDGSEVHISSKSEPTEEREGERRRGEERKEREGEGRRGREREERGGAQESEGHWGRLGNLTFL